MRIRLTNTGDRLLKTFPTLRLNGNLLPLTTADGQAVPVEIPPAGQVELVPGLLLARVSQGPHLLQLVFLEDDVRRVTTFPVNLTLREQTAEVVSRP